MIKQKLIGLNIFIYLVIFSFSCNKTKLSQIEANKIHKQIIDLYNPFEIENFNLKQLTVDDGLSSNEILTLHCDTLGRIWVGTDNGVICYNGINFTWYNPGLPLSKNFNDKKIQDIKSDSKGNIWFLSSKRNLYKYDIKTKKFSSFVDNTQKELHGANASSQFLSLMIDSKDRIWINRYCSYFDQKVDSFIHPIFYNYQSHESFFEENDTIYSILTSWEHKKYYVFYYEEKTNSFTYLINKGKINNNTTLTHFSKNIIGDILFSDQDARIIYKMKNDKQLTICDSCNIGGTKKNIIFDPVSNAFWIASWGGGIGIAKIDTNKRFIYKYFKPRIKNNLPQVPVISIAADKLGNIWMGTYGEGIYIITPFYDKIEVFNNNNNSNGNLLNDNIGTDYPDNIQCFHEFNDSCILIGTKNGLFNFNPKINYFNRIHLKRYRNICSDNWVSGIVPYDKNNVLVTIWGGAIQLFNPKTQKVSTPNLNNFNFKTKNKYKCFWVNNVQRKKNKIFIDIWNGGVLIINTHNNTISRLNNLNTKVLSSTLTNYSYLDKDNKFWISNTTDKSLDVFNFSKYSLIGNITYSNQDDSEYNVPVVRYNNMNLPKGLKSLQIQKILEDTKGRMWISTPNGLHLKDSIGNFIPFGFSEGFPSEYIYDIVEDSDNYLWITTKLGLIKFNPDTKKIIKFFNPKNTKNLQGASFSAKNSLLSSNGSLYFGGNNGFNIIKPAHFKSNYKSKIYVDNFIADSKDVKSFNDSIYLLEDGTKTISIKFINSDILSSADLTYTYHLTGTKENIFIKQKSNKLELNNLRSGTYTLTTSSFNTISGLQSFESIIKFKIQKSYWKSIWFILLSIITVAYISYLIIKKRLKFIHDKHKKDLDFQYLKIQNLQTQLHPHFIFNVLGAIQNLILGNKPYEANDNLIKLKKLMRNFLDASVISSHLNDNSPNEIVLKKEIELLQMYIDFELLKSRNGFDFEFSVSKEIDSLLISIPPIIIQPFVENAIEHGLLPLEKRKGKLKIKFHLKNDFLICEIEDDGIGRKASKIFKNKYKNQHESHGIDLVKQRIKLLNERGAKIILKIEDLEQGTKVTLKFS